MKNQVCKADLFARETEENIRKIYTVLKIRGSSKDKVDSGNVNVDPFVGSFKLQRDKINIKAKFDYVLFDDSEAKMNDLIEGIYKFLKRESHTFLYYRR